MFGDFRHPWLGVEIRHLATLDTIARTGSFREAADELGYVQSAVSQQISRLERQLGARLIDRRRGRPGVTLTAAGEVVARHARATLSQLGAAGADLRAAADNALRVGVCENNIAQLIPPLTAGDPRHPADLQIHEAQTRRELLTLLNCGVLDAAITDLPLPDGPFYHDTLAEQPCTLVVAANSPLARRGAAPELADIAAFPLIVDPSSPIVGELDAALRAAGAPPRYTHPTGNARAQQALAACGVGAALMSPLTFDATDPRTAGIDLDGLLPAHTIALVRHAKRRAAGALTRLERLAAALKTHLAEPATTRPAAANA